MSRDSLMRRAAARVRGRGPAGGGDGIHPALERQLAAPPRWMYPWQIDGRTPPVLHSSVGHTHATKEQMMESEVRQALDAAGPGANAIDIACNEGWFAQRSLEWGADHVLGIDIRWQNVRRAELVRDHYGIPASKLELREGDVYELDHGALGQFDLVLVLGIFYHVEDPVGLFRIARRLTRPGGLCVVEGQLTRHHEPTEWWMAEKPFHSPASFAAHLEPDADHNPVASAKGILSLIPNRAAVEEMGHVAGFDEVRWAEAPTDGSQMFVIGDRGVAFLR